VSLKPAAERQVIGRPARRLDALAAVTGRKQYTLDLDIPGAKPVMVCRPPTINGTVRSVNNAAEVEKMPGVIGVAALPAGGRVARIPPGVAVMAETFGQAVDAINALDVTWGAGPVDEESNDSIQQRLREAVLPFVAPPLGSLTVEAEFEWAPACHAALETECAVADVREDSCQIWAPTQSPIVTQQAMADELGLSQEQVTVNVIPGGGAFGRRVFWDPVQQAVHASKLFGRPAKLMYHRTDDMRHTRMRPPQYHKVRATIVGGQVATFEQRIASVSLDFSLLSCRVAIGRRVAGRRRFSGLLRAVLCFYGQPP